MVENATMIPEGVVLVERKVRFLVRQCNRTDKAVSPSVQYVLNKHRLWDHRCVFNFPVASSIPFRPKDRKPLECVDKGQIPGEAI